MEMKLRKIWPLVGALCLGLTSSVFAHSNYQNGNGSSSYGSSSAMDSSSNQGNYQRGTFREITPNAGPRVAHGADVFMTADFIWWKASDEGLAAGATGVAPGDSDASNPFNSAVKGKIVSAGEDWAPGFKVGLGLNLGHDGWDVYTQYTWLHASNTVTLERVPDQVFFPELAPFNDGPSYSGNKATGKWDLHFNAVDLELGRNFYLSQFLTMRPHVGLKGTWQSHDNKNTLAGNDFEIEVDNQGQQDQDITVTGPGKINKSFDAWGIGVRAGFNMAYYMSKSWSIYGDLSFSTLFTAYYDQKYTNTLEDTTSGNKRVYANIDNDTKYTCKFVPELELGLRWETWFYDDNYHFAVQAGWEQQVWVNFADYIQLLDDNAHDMTLQGLNLKFRFDF